MVSSLIYYNELDAFFIVPEAPPTQPSDVTRPQPSTSTIAVVLPPPDQITTGEL